MSEQANNPFAYLVAVFLSEVIRSRQTSIKRAAEISGRVVDNIAGIQSEEQALVFVTQLETDFEEVQTLKQALHFGYSASDISVYESEIKEFSAQLFRQDMVQSSQFLQDA
ncbi:MAG TPA: hypothetical protein VHA30_04835, partial [Patescibacteria group bacterium]|nr:hypothetical protein [Patescibacteria group bacterium]